MQRFTGEGEPALTLPRLQEPRHSRCSSYRASDSWCSARAGSDFETEKGTHTFKVDSVLARKTAAKTQQIVVLKIVRR